MNKKLPSKIPIFPLKGVILFPGSNLPLNIFEKRYIRMIEDVIRTDHRILGMVQPKEMIKKSNTSNHFIGCAGKLIKFEELDNNKYLIAIKGISRFNILTEELLKKGYICAKVNYKNYENDKDWYKDYNKFIYKNDSKLKYALKNYFVTKNINSDWDQIKTCENIDLINQISMICPFSSSEKQMLLESKSIEDRYVLLTSILEINSLSESKSNVVKH